MKIIRSQGLKIFFPFFIQLTNTNLQFPQCSHQEAMGGKHIIISLYYAISACFATSPLYHDKALGRSYFSLYFMHHHVQQIDSRKVDWEMEGGGNSLKEAVSTSLIPLTTGHVILSLT